MTDLPILTIQSTFSKMLKRANVVVEASTGSGKSTCLPLWCRQLGRVLVIEPRRLACVSLARFLSRQEQDIGYAIRFQSHFTEQSQVVFATPGIVLRWLAENQLQDFDVVMLDEFHERRMDTDLIAAILLKMAQHRLVVTSATVDGERLAQYFQAQLLKAEGKLFELEISYTEQLDLPNTRHLPERVYHAIKALAPGTKGDILVFLPGKAEIHKTEQLLRSRLSLTVLPLHAGVDENTQDQALSKMQEARIILATNVAETSVTLPGVRTVIDSGLEKRSHQRNGRRVLGLHHISQASAQQRAGRAGRLGPGQVIRLWGKQAKLETFTPAEVLREELTELILASASLGHRAQDLHFADALPPHALLRDETLLKNIGALSDQGFVTEYGRTLFPLAIDTLFAHLISAMQDKTHQEAMVDLCAALSTQRSVLPSLKPEQYECLKDWISEDCDATTLIQIMRQKAPMNIPVDQRALQEARNISHQLRKQLGLNSIQQTSDYDRETLMQQTLKAAPQLAYVRREKRPASLGNGFSEIEVGRESRFNEEALAAVVFDQHSIPGKGTLKTINYGTCMAPIRLKLLSELNLGQQSNSQPQLKDNTVMVLRQTHYAGRCIHQETILPKGEILCEALAQLILQGRLLSPLGERVQKDIQAWNLFLSLGESDGEPQESEAWLSQSLKDLGIENMQDFSLIQAEDIEFEGIPQWQRKEFDHQYPLQLQLENMTVSLQYCLKSRKIILRYEKGSRKKAPRRKELPRWPGWKLVFQYGQRESDIL